MGTRRVRVPPELQRPEELEAETTDEHMPHGDLTPNNATLLKSMYPQYSRQAIPVPLQRARWVSWTRRVMALGLAAMFVAGLLQGCVSLVRTSKRETVITQIPEQPGAQPRAASGRATNG